MVRSPLSFRSLASKSGMPRFWFASLLASLVMVVGACSDDDDSKNATPDAADADSGIPTDPDAGGQDDASTSDDAGTTPDASDPGDAGTDAGDAAPAGPVFSTTKLTFTAEVGAGPGVCYDIDTAAAVDCATGAGTWDLMFEVDAVNHSYNIWTAGGVKGTGQGASFGPVPQATIDAMASSKDVPGWFADYFGGVFVEFPWYEYDVLGTHDVSANGRVYVVDTGTDKYKVQLTSYYGEGGASGMVTLRYGKLSESTYDQVVLDATAGGFGAPPGSPSNKAAYFDLDAKAIVAIDDTEAKANAVWDIAVKRFNVTLNGGASGPGTVKAAVADKREALYDAGGKPIKAQFQAITPQGLKDAFEAVTTDTGLTYKLDKANPYILNDGSDKGWFGVNPPPPMPPTFFARPENWWAIRSAGGDSYAKFHVTKVDSATRAFTIELFVQPKAD